MKYQTKDGEIFEAESNEELVKKLHEASGGQEPIAEWMLAMAIRSRIASGCPVDGSTFDTLVRDLLAARLLTICGQEPPDDEEDED